MVSAVSASVNGGNVNIKVRSKVEEIIKKVVNSKQ
jgi:hypothetical protein